MNELRYTLLSDGSSDRALIPILTWVLRAKGVQYAIQPEWADLRPLRQEPKKLPDRIRCSLELYPCDLLFIHRDAEKEAHSKRVEEVRRAVKKASALADTPPSICVVPVRMQEAWLLFDEVALRIAAGNPNGRQPLQIPRLTHLEHLPDPKTILHSVLAEASDLQGRKLEKFSVRSAVHRVAELIDDFSPLRALPAFQALETEVETLIREQGWDAEFGSS